MKLVIYFVYVIGKKVNKPTATAEKPAIRASYFQFIEYNIFDFTFTRN